MNFLRRFADDETTINPPENSRCDQQHDRTVDNQICVISNYQPIEHLRAGGVNVGTPLGPSHKERIERALPTQRQTLQEENPIADDNWVKAKPEHIYEFGIACQRSDGKIDCGQNQMSNNHKNQEVFDVRKDFHLLHDHARTAKPLQHEQCDHESRQTTGKHKETAKKLSQ